MIPLSIERTLCNFLNLDLNNPSHTEDCKDITSCKSPHEMGFYDLIFLVENELKQPVPDNVFNYFISGPSNEITQALLTLKISQHVQIFIDAFPHEQSPAEDAYIILKINQFWTAHNKSLLYATGNALHFLYSHDKGDFRKLVTEQHVNDTELRITINSFFPYLGGKSFLIPKDSSHFIPSSSPTSSSSTPSYPHKADFYQESLISETESLLDDLEPVYLDYSMKDILPNLKNAILDKDTIRLSTIIEHLKNQSREILRDELLSFTGRQFLLDAIKNNFPEGILSFGELLKTAEVSNRTLCTFLRNSFTSVISAIVSGANKIDMAYTKLLSSLTADERNDILISVSQWWLKFAVEMRNFKIFSALTPFLALLTHDGIITLLNDTISTSKCNNNLLMQAMALNDVKVVHYLSEIYSLLPPDKIFFELMRKNNDGNTAFTLAINNNCYQSVDVFLKLICNLGKEQQLILTYRQTTDSYSYFQTSLAGSSEPSTELFKDFKPKEPAPFLKKQLATAFTECDLEQINALQLVIRATDKYSPFEKAMILWVDNLELRQKLLSPGSHFGKTYCELVDRSGLPPTTIELLLHGEMPPMWCLHPVPADSLTQHKAIEFLEAVLYHLPTKVSTPTGIAEVNKMAQQFFEPLFYLKPAPNTHVKATSPIVSGDTDGSTTRMILLGIQAGMISITKKGCQYLAVTMCSEVLTVNSYTKEVVNYQKNQETRQIFAKLMNELSFHYGNTPLIFLGDTAHDRFSCNKDIDRVVREWLKASGAIFILGNHDTIEALNNGLTHKFSDLYDRASWGAYAYNSGDICTWRDHTNYVFINTHWDHNTRTLFTHNGIAFDDDNIVTAFGTLTERPLNPCILASEINKLSSSDVDKFTRFRPSSDNSGGIIELSVFYSLRQVHGHDSDCYNFSDKVYGLNSRSDGKYIISAMILGDNPKYPSVL